jgi:lipopolysaccharide transport system ATP-binding protein
MIAVKIEGLSKNFKLKGRSRMLNRDVENDVDALKNVSFTAKKGECVGIIGRNGSGKTTLLKIMSGIIKPDKGNMTINGKLMSFIDLNAGVNPELTGKENVFLYGSLLGMDKGEIKEKLDSIIDYAQIPKKFINTKFKNYSEGMKARLTFSIAMANSPDILLIDEAISVGDESFQKKSFNKIKELRKEGKTVLIVSHSISSLLEICDSIYLLEEGQLIKKGEPVEIINYYLSNVYDKDIQLLIESVNNKRFEIKKLEKGLKSKKTKKSLFRKLDNRNASNKIPELKKEIFDQLSQIVHVLFWKNVNLLNLESLYKKNKNNKKKLNELENIKKNNDFTILENIFLMSEYIEDGTLSNKIIAIAEGAFKDLCESVSTFGETKKVLEYFEQLNSLTTSLGFIDSKRKTLSDFRYFAKQKAVRFKNKKFEKKLGSILNDVNNKEDIKKSISIREQEGDFREKFNFLEDENERKILINDFLSVCRKHLEDINDVNEKYLFFKNTYLSILQNVVSQIKESEFKIGFVMDLKETFDNEINNKNLKESSKTIDILGSFLRNELLRIEDSYLDLNIKINDNKDSSKKEKMKKELEDIRKIKFKLSKAIAKLYQKDFVNEKASWGFGDIIIKNIEFFNSQNKSTNVFKPNEKFSVNIDFSSKKKIENPEFGIAIHKDNGVNICNDSFVYNQNKGIFSGNGQIKFVLDSLPLKQGNYLLSVSVYDSIMNIPHDHHFKAYPFFIEEKNNETNEGGLLAIKGKWKIN